MKKNSNPDGTTNKIESVLNIFEKSLNYIILLMIVIFVLSQKQMVI